GESAGSSSVSRRSSGSVSTSTGAVCVLNSSMVIPYRSWLAEQFPVLPPGEQGTTPPRVPAGGRRRWRPTEISMLSCGRTRGNRMETRGRQVGIVGDFDAKNETHQVTNRALAHVGLHFEWVPTVEVMAERPQERLTAYAASSLRLPVPIGAWTGRSRPSGSPASAGCRSSEP